MNKKLKTLLIILVLLTSIFVSSKLYVTEDYYNNIVGSIEKIDEGSEEILQKISMKENSYSKAYEICKNSTIYTMDSQELQERENEYLDEIMPTLYKIVTKLQHIYYISTIYLRNKILTKIL